jgi:proteic killer suppression protein
MIRSFQNKGLKRFAETGNGKGLSVQNHDRVGQILQALDAATHAEDMNLPGLKFHPLKGADKGRFSVWVTGNYRITFAFDGVNAVDVDLKDYHR